MNRTSFCVLTVLATLALPGVASAKIVELGAGSSQPAASKCPEFPCQAIYQVTGYQGRSGDLKDPFIIKENGYLVAFSVVLPEMADNQIADFTSRFGGPPSVRLSVLRRGDTRKTRLNHRLARQSPVVEVEDYLGSTPHFVLREPLRVRKDNIVALTVPTWLPALAIDLGTGNWWRSARPKGKCGTAEELAPPSTQEETGADVVRYGCTYKKARLLYTASFVADPQPTKPSAE